MTILLTNICNLKTKIINQAIKNSKEINNKLSKKNKKFKNQNHEKA